MGIPVPYDIITQLSYFPPYGCLHARFKSKFSDPSQLEIKNKLSNCNTVDVTISVQLSSADDSPIE